MKVHENFIKSDELIVNSMKINYLTQTKQYFAVETMLIVAGEQAIIPQAGVAMPKLHSP